MTTLHTPRFNIPLLAAGQAQKELFHNEALTGLDLLVHPVVQSIENNPETLTPEPGQCWLVSESPDGAWSQFANQIAGWTSGGWRYFQPIENMQIHVSSAQQKAVFASGIWVINPAVSNPSGGAVVDLEARQAIESILLAMKTMGILTP